MSGLTGLDGLARVGITRADGKTHARRIATHVCSSLGYLDLYRACEIILTYKYEDFQIVVINGKHTNRLEVSQIPGRDGELLDVTKLERTLIDIAVRPNYGGGVVQVLEAFERAKPSVSINTLVATLKKLNYVYPYHQVIGFYMERAGYPENQWQKLIKLGLQFDFYLTYQLPPGKKYDPKWRLYYPGSL